jgi:hypothetical protein
MSRKFKVIGLALVAVLAISAVSAGAAQAAPKFTSEGTPTWLTGEQTTKNVFTTNGGKIECTGATFESGEIKGTELTSVTVHPVYTGCKAFGLAATITTTGCNFVLTAAGTATVECESGKVITISIPSASCTLTVGAQGPLSSVTYTNSGGAGKLMDIVVNANVAGITYTSSNSASACGASGTNGTYVGGVTVRGYSSATTHTEATQRGITWDAS